MTIRTILVDDEKLAIQGLQVRLEPFEDVKVIDTCSNGREAIRKIKTEKPDLVFLDIQMPGFDGFSVVKGVMGIEPPLFWIFAVLDNSIELSICSPAGLSSATMLTIFANFCIIIAIL